MQSLKCDKRIEVLAECYANKCIAIELLQAISKSIRCSAKIRHSYKQGRDRIVQEVVKPLRECVRIAVIDYEKGASRIFIDKNFSLEKVWSGVFIGVSKRSTNSIAIVFDPNIEEALLCRIDEEICRDIYLYQKVKSRDACSVMSRILDSSEFNEFLNKVASRVIDILKHLTSDEAQ